MRAYFFGNFYLSSIQQGIQAAHCVADMFTKYKTPSPARDKLYEWAVHHKVMVLLNGGNAADLKELYLVLRGICSALDYPHEVFMEDTISLNNATTCVGVVVPEKIYEYNDWVRKAARGEIELTDEELAMDRPTSTPPYDMLPLELQIAEIIAAYGLAK